MSYRDCYRWIDPWDEMDRLEYYLRQEEEVHHEAMSRQYRAMADENHRDRAHVESLMRKFSDVAAMTPAPVFFQVKK